MARGMAAAAAERTVRVRDADFTADFASIRHVRETVFIDEQRVPRELEFDDRDPLCLHVLVFDGDAPVGTGRLDLDYGGKVGRVAVVATHRRAGVGTAVMERLHAIARERKHAAAVVQRAAHGRAVLRAARLREIRPDLRRSRHRPCAHGVRPARVVCSADSWRGYSRGAAKIGPSSLLNSGSGKPLARASAIARSSARAALKMLRNAMLPSWHSYGRT